MRERSGLIVGALVVLLSILPLGFIVHVSPRFPGSLVGSLIGILGAVLMLVPLAYLVIKRVPPLRRHVTRRVSMPTLLAIHIYAGVLGPILGVIHSAHKFESPLGVSLLGMMLVVVFSGYTGRYLLAQAGRAVRGRRAELAQLRDAFSADRAAAPPLSEPARPGLVGRLLFRSEGESDVARTPSELALALADVEYAVRAEEVIDSLFRKWLKLHIVIATILYALLALHIWSGLYYGLRWL